MSDQALLLASEGLSPEGRNLAKVLRFFGVPSRALTVPEFISGCAPVPGNGSKARLLCPAGSFLKLLLEMEGRSERVEMWRTRVHSAFIHAEADPSLLQRLMETLVGGGVKAPEPINGGGNEFVVTEQADDFCGVMAGIRMVASQTGVAGGFILRTPKAKAVNLITTADGAVFLKLEYAGVPVFLSACSRIVDLDAELATGIFNLQDHLMSAAPVVLYVKWAFAETCWKGPETNACLVIDDPLLKPAYGFVNFYKLLSLMKRHRFSTNIAFIPWNYRRSVPQVVELIKANPGQYSLSIHGCDHTRAEFGCADRHHLYWKVRRAVERMARHERQTGIHHDPVMVFPQGVFSEAAMSALKHTGLVAAVNNDTISADPHPRAIKISDVWDVALMGYSDFPLFTRRYPWDGVENFAFDILLGKPCIIVIHHDFCRDGGQQLVNFVSQLNALKCPLTWRSLGEVVRRGFRERKVSSGMVELEMYGHEVRIENPSGVKTTFHFRKRESAPETIKEIRVETQSVKWTAAENHIAFDTLLNPGESKIITVVFKEISLDLVPREGLYHRSKVMLRRILSEARDNYLTRTSLSP